MSEYDKKREGQPLEVSAKAWNELLDLLAKKAQPGLSTPAIDGRPSLLGGPALRASSTGGSASWSLLKATTPQLTTEQALLFDMSMNLSTAGSGSGGVAAAEPSGRYAHLGYAISANEEAYLTYAGIVPALIYVHDAKHRFVDLPYTATQSAHWESDWDGPHEILWKESGTGDDKKAILRLGDNRPRVLWGVCSQNWRKRGGIPSQVGKWAYVKVELLDYTTATSGLDACYARVLLPTNMWHDPCIIAGQVIGFQKYYCRSELQHWSGFENDAWPTYRYFAVSNNYYSSFVGDTKIVLHSDAWSGNAAQGWAKVNGSQDTAKTRSGIAANASNRFLLFQKNASETGGGDDVAFKSADVISNITSHPVHNHPIPRDAVWINQGDGAATFVMQPQANTSNNSGVQNHVPIDADHEIELEIPKPAWLGAQLYERIDNSAGDEE